MNESRQNSSKVLWLSPKKLVFEWKEGLGVHFPWGYCDVGNKTVLIIAQEGKDLFFVENGEAGGYFKDLLCWFCQNSINLGKLGHAPTCLLGKYILDVTICKDFVPGACFGENMDNDVGERRLTAEKILPLIEWQSCGECKFFNTDKAFKSIDNDDGGVVVEDLSARFCEILHALPKPHYGRKCKRFEISGEPCKRKLIEARKKSLIDYLTSLKQ